MHLYTPVLVLVPDTVVSSDNYAKSPSLLVQYILDEFPAVPVEPVARKFWNEGVGTCYSQWNICTSCLLKSVRKAWTLSISSL